MEEGFLALVLLLNGRPAKDEYYEDGALTGYYHLLCLWIGCKDVMLLAPCLVYCKVQYILRVRVMFQTQSFHQPMAFFLDMPMYGLLRTQAYAYGTACISWLTIINRLASNNNNTGPENLFPLPKAPLRRSLSHLLHRTRLPRPTYSSDRSFITYRERVQYFFIPSTTYFDLSNLQDYLP